MWDKKLGFIRSGRPRWSGIPIAVLAGETQVERLLDVLVLHASCTTSPCRTFEEHVCTARVLVFLERHHDQLPEKLGRHHACGILPARCIEPRIGEGTAVVRKLKKCWASGLSPLPRAGSRGKIGGDHLFGFIFIVRVPDGIECNKGLD